MKSIKKWLAVLLLMMGFMASDCYAQVFTSTKARITFSCPAGYKRESIKVGDVIAKFYKRSTDRMILIGYGEVGAPSNVTPWDDIIHQLTYNSMLEAGTVVYAMKNLTITSKTGKKKCLGVIKELYGSDYTTFDYIFLHHGDRVCISLAIPSWSGNESDIVTYSSILKGLSFK